MYIEWVGCQLPPCFFARMVEERAGMECDEDDEPLSPEDLDVLLHATSIDWCIDWPAVELVIN